MRAWFSKLLIVLFDYIRKWPGNLHYVFYVWRVFVSCFFAAVDCVPDHFYWVDADFAGEYLIKPNTRLRILNRTVINSFLNLNINKLQNKISELAFQIFLLEHF